MITLKSWQLTPTLLLGALLPNQAQSQGFVDRTAQANLILPTEDLAFGAHSRGVAACDFDNDGDLDLIIPGFGPTPVRYYENDGTGTFTDQTAGRGLPLSGNTISLSCADFDNDGDSDLFIGRLGLDSFYANDGTGHFQNISFTMGVNNQAQTLGACWGDYDLDGFLDVVLLSWDEHFPNQLYHNDGGIGFTRQPASAGLDELSATLAGTWMDYNDDGWPDFYTANDKGHDLLPNVMYLNNGDGTFTDVAVQTNTHEPMFAMGIDFTDVFNDGGLDFFVTDGPDFHLFAVWNPFSQAYDHQEHIWGLQGGTDGWCVEWLDYNNDGWQDLYVTHEYQLSPLFENPCQGVDRPIPFTNVQPTLIPQMINRNQNCMVVADFDNDGRDDLLNIFRDHPNPGPSMQLLMNQVPGGNWLRFDLEGVRTNRDGFGSKIQVTTADGNRQTQWARSMVGFSSTTDQRVHFGVGAHSTVDRVRVRWLSGQEQILKDVPVNQTLELREPDYRMVGTAAPGSTSTFQLDSMGDAGLPFLMPISATPGQMPLPSGRSIPLQFDGLSTFLIVQGNGIMTNPIGVLDSNGQATSDLVLPALPSLSGLQLYSTAIVLDNTEPEGIRTILPVVEVPIQ